MSNRLINHNDVKQVAMPVGAMNQFWKKYNGDVWDTLGLPLNDLSMTPRS